jgi:hypothetical protein
MTLLQWHLDVAVMDIFAGDPDDMVCGSKAIVIPLAWREVCHAYDALPKELQ